MLTKNTLSAAEAGRQSAIPPHLLPGRSRIGIDRGRAGDSVLSCQLQREPRNRPAPPDELLPHFSRPADQLLTAPRYSALGRAAAPR